MDFKPERKILHPCEKANFLSKIFFCWTIPTFIKGYKQELNEEDLHGHLKDHESEGLGNKLQEKWLLEMLRSKPSLIRTIWIVFKYEICLQGIILFVIELGVKLVYPICLGKLMELYVPNQKQLPKDNAYLYGFIIILTSFFNVLLGHNYMMANQHLGMKIRVACCSLIYRKSLKLNRTGKSNTTTGQIINLMSNDVNRFDTLFLHFHNLWMAPLQIIVVTYLLYNFLGVYSLSGIALFLCVIPLQYMLGKRSAKYRLNIARRTDERVRLIDEIISGIKVIKMYTWEKPFETLVREARKYETKEIRAASIIRAIHASFSMFLNRTALFVSILAYTLAGNIPDAYYVFVIISLYNVLRQSMVFHLPQAISTLGETSVSIRRLEDFLMNEEDVENAGVSKTTYLERNPSIDIKDVSAKWDFKSPENTLSNVNLTVQKELVAIIGPVGSGKSSILHVILKELPVLEGTVNVNGTISYASQTPWLFDETIMDNILFGQQLNEKRYEEVCHVCALEKDLSDLPHGDQTIVGDRGVMLSGGQKARINLARAIYKDADIYLLDDPLSAVDANVGKQLFENCILQYLKNKCVLLVTHQLEYLPKISRICVVQNGMTKNCGTFEEIYSSDDNDFVSVLKNHNDKSNFEEETNNTKNTEPIDNINMIKEQKQAGEIEKRVYGKYIKAAGGYFMGLLIIMSFFIAQFLASGADYFVTYWVNLEQLKNDTINNKFDGIIYDQQSIFMKSENCVYFYTFLICSFIIVAFIRSISFMEFCMRASKNLHHIMFSNLISTSLRFFHVNPSGRVLNRFSKDIGAIDEVLPSVILETLQVFFNVIFIAAIIGMINPWILIPTGFMLAIFYWLKLFFLASSRNIKRMEATSKSPVFSHITTSMQGLTTIKAFDAQENFRKNFDYKQNLHSSAFFMYLACNRTFGLWLDMICVVYVSFVIMGILFMINETFGGNIGLSITQSLALTGMFQWGIRQWSELENQMVSVERVVEYAELKPEPDFHNTNIPIDFPHIGGIQFHDVSFRYALDSPIVLKKVNIIIKPQEKVGIVGRTGAGKSSLVAALFRLGEVKGNILIDDVDIGTVSLQNIRSKISIIPQDSLLFSGTLRRNLDPSDQYQDNELWKVLRDVGLEKVTSQLSAGLDSKVSEGGSNFSVGERQLICLARAIIRNNKILILDEATANVDPETDMLIQHTIKERFQRCTVLTIAHRLQTIMDSDRILVMDDGCMVEFDNPHKLLQNINSKFYELVNQIGNSC